MAEPTWMGFQLPAAAHWRAFHLAFYELYRQHPQQDLLAVFTALDNRRIVVLPPLAAALVAQHLPKYQLRPCPRPPGTMLALELGHRLQLDTTWFELSEDERRARAETFPSPAVGIPLPPETPPHAHASKTRDIARSFHQPVTAEKD